MISQRALLQPQNRVDHAGRKCQPCAMHALRMLARFDELELPMRGEKLFRMVHSPYGCSVAMATRGDACESGCRAGGT